MKKYVCKYVVLRFAPYSETGEFANVGVILYSKSSNTFSFKLDNQDVGGRVSKFFHIEDKGVFKHAMTAYMNELKYINEQVVERKLSAQSAFEYFVKPRATLLRFSEPRTLITDSVADALKNVYERMVTHSSKSQIKDRLKLRKALRYELSSLKLENPFKQHKFERIGFAATFDFTQLDQNDSPVKLIQPIEIEGRSVKEIFEVVDKNEIRLKRMNDLGLLPKKILLPFTLDFEHSKEIDEAWSVLKNGLSNFGELVDIDDKSTIKEFALN